MLRLTAYQSYAMQESISKGMLELIRYELCDAEQISQTELEFICALLKVDVYFRVSEFSLFAYLNHHNLVGVLDEYDVIKQRLSDANIITCTNGEIELIATKHHLLSPSLDTTATEDDSQQTKLFAYDSTTDISIPSQLSVIVSLLMQLSQQLRKTSLVYDPLEPLTPAESYGKIMRLLKETDTEQAHKIEIRHTERLHAAHHQKSNCATRLRKNYVMIEVAHEGDGRVSLAALLPAMGANLERISADINLNVGVNSDYNASLKPLIQILRSYKNIRSYKGRYRTLMNVLKSIANDEATRLQKAHTPGIQATHRSELLERKFYNDCSNDVLGIILRHFAATIEQIALELTSLDIKRNEVPPLNSDIFESVSMDVGSITAMSMFSPAMPPSTYFDDQMTIKEELDWDDQMTIKEEPESPPSRFSPY